MRKSAIEIHNSYFIIIIRKKTEKKAEKWFYLIMSKKLMNEIANNITREYLDNLKSYLNQQHIKDTLVLAFESN